MIMLIPANVVHVCVFFSHWYILRMLFCVVCKLKYVFYVAVVINCSCNCHKGPQGRLVLPTVYSSLNKDIIIIIIIIIITYSLNFRLSYSPFSDTSILYRNNLVNKISEEPLWLGS